MSNIYRWINKEKNRYYTISVSKKSTNEIHLKYKWGSLISNRGGRKLLSVSDEKEMEKSINYMMKRRKSRGYELVI